MTVPAESGYKEALALAKATIQRARTQAVLAVNSELIGLYWDLGRLILDRQQADGPRSQVVERLSSDLRAAFPGMRGLSPGNLNYMRRLAAAWPDRSYLRLVGKIPWGHNQTLLDKLSEAEKRSWYATKAIENGWSRVVLETQIATSLHLRAGAAPSNFERLLPPGDSELMQQAMKDPYSVEFLMLNEGVNERQVEQAMIDNLDRFLRELGQGFSYVGRQWRLDLDGDEYFVDLLMFHADSNRYVVIELKNRKVTPGDIGQLNFYVALVDDTMRRTHHAETVGILLCTARSDRMVRYALGHSTSPMAVAGLRYNELPAGERSVLPPEDELLAVVTEALAESAGADPDGS
jgi:predicted nuclease of restriction endonuclease-like (RecB) superfamily